MQPSPFMTAAQAAADAAEKVIRHYYATGVDVETKADDTPVTRADVESEQAIRQVIRERFPEHGFYGEETGQSDMDSDYVWLIDPIDGTKSFVRRYPFFSTQIALMHKGELILGLSNGMQFGERAWAEKGQGAYLNGEPIRVEPTTELSRATLSTGNLKRLTEDAAAWNALGGIIGEVHRIRGYGDFYHYHLLARGCIDLIVESDVNILDIAALAVIVRESGGIFTTLSGAEPDLQTRDVLAAASPSLHQTVQTRLGWKTRPHDPDR